jgi:hypothetical protein
MNLLLLHTVQGLTARNTGHFKTQAHRFTILIINEYRIELSMHGKYCHKSKNFAYKTEI